MCSLSSRGEFISNRNVHSHAISQLFYGVGFGTTQGRVQDSRVWVCERSGASIAATALANGVNAHLVITGEGNDETVSFGLMMGETTFYTATNSNGPLWPSVRRLGGSITAVACSHSLRPALILEQ